MNPIGVIAGALLVALVLTVRWLADHGWFAPEPPGRSRLVIRLPLGWRVERFWTVAATEYTGCGHSERASVRWWQLHRLQWGQAPKGTTISSELEHAFWLGPIALYRARAEGPA